jgi:hypothetical protein
MSALPPKADIVTLYSITSSARFSSDGSTVMPSVFADLRAPLCVALERAEACCRPGNDYAHLRQRSLLALSKNGLKRARYVL